MPPHRSAERLLVLTQFYEPEPNFITADMAARLAEDFDVTVVSPHPNYPLNRFYPGTRSWWRPVKSVERGVTVWRLPIFPYHGRSHLLRACCYLSFALQAAVLAPALCPNPRVVWVYNGPFTVALAAVWYKLVLRARIVFTSADLWPESLLAAGVARPGLTVRMMFSYSRLINRLADAIVCSTRGMLERFARDGIDRRRLSYVPVWVPGVAELAASCDANREPANRIVYVGNIGPSQRLDTVVRAAAILEQRGVPVAFDFYGEGLELETLRRLASDLGVAGVRFHQRVPASVAFEVSASALGQVISLEPSPQFAMTVPSKLSFCCAAGAPLLFGLTGEARDLAIAADGGFAFDPADPGSLATAVERLVAASGPERTRMSANLRRFYRDHFDTTALLERCRATIVGDRPAESGGSAGQRRAPECRM